MKLEFQKERRMTETFSYLKKSINPQTQEAQQILSRIITKKATLTYVIIKFLKTRDKEILKEGKEKTHYVQKKKDKNTVDSCEKLCKPETQEQHL